MLEPFNEGFYLLVFFSGKSSALGVKVGKMNNFSFSNRTCLGLPLEALSVFSPEAGDNLSIYLR